MSPEQVTAQKSIDARSDLWALGVVTFEALTGQRPFDGPSFGALAVKIATGTPARPSSVDPALPVSFDAWFARACARDPADRFANAKSLAEGLREAFSGVVSLPPSGVMTDSSGERKVPTPDPSSPTISKRAPTPTELASTVNQATPDPSLSRSDSGSAVPAAPEPAKKKNGKMIAGLAALCAVAAGVVALGMGRGPSQTGTPATKGPPSTTSAKNAPPPIDSHPNVVLSESMPPSSASASAGPVASASASASSTAAKRAPHTVGKPVAAAKPSGPAPAKPEESARPAPKPSTSGGDILY
jgi:serine/threonine-protein kinase